MVPVIDVRGLEIGYDPEVLVRGITFTVAPAELDDLILGLRDALGTTVVVVSHELPQIFAIADNSIFLDPETKSMIAHGDPKELVREGVGDPKVREFLTRGVLTTRSKESVPICKRCFRAQRRKLVR